MLGPRYQSVTHLLPEPAHRKGHPLTFDQAVVEPGRAGAVNLRLKPLHKIPKNLRLAITKLKLDKETGRPLEIHLVDKLAAVP
jgi:hypothetical protein